MKWLARKPMARILAIGLIGAAAGVILWLGLSRAGQNRVYRIGWQSDPPFHAVGEQGQATGLGVELVREAARRRGIRLDWIRQPDGGDAALREGRVDLWPLITIVPERRSYVHLTAPYLESSYCLLVRADSAYLDIAGLAEATISHNGAWINERNLRILLPKARVLHATGTGEAIENLCEHRAEAV